MSASAFAYKKQKAICERSFGDASWIGELDPTDVQRTGDRTAAHLQISQLLFARYKKAHITPANQVMSNSVVEHGFSVIGRGIARCDEAYLNYCAINQQTAQGTELTQALRSPQTVRLFPYLASMRDDKNHPYELWLGLAPTRAARNEFIYFPQEDAHFEPNPQLYNIALEEAAARAVEKGLSPELTDKAPDICPARRFIPQAWEIVVNGCEQAGLFDFVIEPVTE